MTNHLIHSVHQILSLQPVDVTHIYVPDLHETRQARKQQSPTVTKVIKCHKTLLELSSELPPSLQVMGRLTSWETWPGGLRGGLGGDEEGSEKEGKQKTSKTKLACPCDDGHAEEEDRDHDIPKQKRLRKETKLHERPFGWTQDEYNKEAQRRGPLEQPRMPDQQWGNMTVDAVEDREDLYFSPLSKEYYRRTAKQTKAVKEAQEDQREVGGGVYSDKANQRQFLTIRKGFASRDVGLKLELVDGRQKELIFDIFAAMQYKFFHFSNESPLRRIRQKRPQETATGFIWYGFGTDLNIPESDVPRGKVYAFCERVGDLHLHFSGDFCERVTEAPGSSQLLCRNEGCGVVAWHFSMKTFECNTSQWEEKHKTTLPL